MGVIAGMTIAAGVAAIAAVVRVGDTNAKDRHTREAIPLETTVAMERGQRFLAGRMIDPVAMVMFLVVLDMIIARAAEVAVVFADMIMNSLHR